MTTSADFSDVSTTTDSLFAIPAKAGIQGLSAQKPLDPRFRWNDDKHGLPLSMGHCR